jgi:hypothetical protein
MNSESGCELIWTLCFELSWTLMNTDSYWTGWTVFSLSYKPWSLTCGKRSVLYCCVTSRRSRGPSYCCAILRLQRRIATRGAERSEWRQGPAQQRSTAVTQLRSSKFPCFNSFSMGRFLHNNYELIFSCNFLFDDKAVEELTFIFGISCNYSCEI